MISTISAICKAFDKIFPKRSNSIEIILDVTVCATVTYLSGRAIYALAKYLIPEDEVNEEAIRLGNIYVEENPINAVINECLTAIYEEYILRASFLSNKLEALPRELGFSMGHTISQPNAFIPLVLAEGIIGEYAIGMRSLAPFAIFVANLSSTVSLYSNSKRKKVLVMYEILRIGVLTCVACKYGFKYSMMCNFMIRGADLVAFRGNC